MRLLESVLGRIGSANQWQRRFIHHLLELLLLVPGKATFRNLSRYSAYSERSFSRGFGRHYDWASFNHAAIGQVITPTHEQALVLDASFVKKSGRCTYGVDRFWNGSANRVEKGLEISVLGWLDISANQAYGLSVEQTPADDPTRSANAAKRVGKGKRRGHAKGTEASVEDSRVEGYLAQVREVVETQRLQHLKYLIVDGYYSKVTFIDGVRALGLHPIGKLRCDADMRYLYTGPKRPGPGAPKRFDGKVDWSDLSRFECVDTDLAGVKLYQQRLNHKRFKRTLKVVVVVDTRGQTPRQAILFSTELELDALTLYRYYKARFQIEFLIRDAKQATGLSDCQSRNPDRLHFHFNASLAAASLAKLQAQQQAGGTLTEPFSIHSLQRRAFNTHVLDQIIAHLDNGQTLTKSSPLYQTLCNYGTIEQPAA